MLKKLITAPAVPAVSLLDIKAHLRIDFDDDDHDDRLIPYLESAVAQVENITGRALITQTWDLVFSSWFELKYAPLPLGRLQAVVDIKYGDPSGVERTVPSESYLVGNVFTDEGWVSLGGFDLPSLGLVDPITVRIIVGYGDSPADIPGSIQSAIKLMVSDMENGCDSSRAIDALLYSHRLFYV